MKNYKLTNRERKFLGLETLDNDWEEFEVKISKGRNYDDKRVYIFFDRDVIKKRIITTEKSYYEDKLNIQTDNRELILPKTKRGKPKKLNFTSISQLNGEGMYFSYDNYNVTIANYHTQKTFYITRLKINKPDNENTFDNLRNWLNDFINDTSNEDLKELERFKMEKRKNVKLNEGDFFVFKLDRREYGYGRIIFDIRKLRRKTGFKSRKNYGLRLIGKPIVVKIYNILIFWVGYQ